MKKSELDALLLLTDGGPVLVLVSGKGLLDAGMLQAMADRGLKRFMAYELSVDEVRLRYGVQFDAVAAGLKHPRSVRILDHDGARIFDNFPPTALNQRLL